MRARGPWALALAGALLAGCASPPADLSLGAASELQHRVLAVTKASSSGDAVTALLRLQELEVAAYGAAARSLISPERLASILASIALVRSDLERLLSEAELAQLQRRLAELEGRSAGQAEAGAGGSGDPGGTEPGGTRSDGDGAPGAGPAPEGTDEKAAEKAREAEQKAREAEQKAEERAADERERAEKRAENDESPGKGRD